MTLLRSTAAVTIIAGIALLAAAPASALGLKDCSDKYTAEKAAGKTGKKTFEEYQKTDCGPDAKPLPAAAVTAPAVKPAKTKKEAAATTAPAATTAATTAAPVAPAVFPSAISAAHKDKKPSKARFATCLDQYKANKATNANGGMKWIQKKGGYYSQCNQKLKEIKA